MLMPEARRFDPQLLLEPDAIHETQHPYQQSIKTLVQDECRWYQTH
jgi:hypothetical protein